MSFRSYFREHAPEFQLLEPLVSLEDERYAYEALQDLLIRVPDLQGLYIGGGGIGGVLRALRERDTVEHLTVIGLDMTDESRESLIDGTIKIMLSHPLPRLSAAVVNAMVLASSGAGANSSAEMVVPMDIQIAESV